jgi:hypothetical protein
MIERAKLFESTKFGERAMVRLTFILMWGMVVFAIVNWIYLVR